MLGGESERQEIGSTIVSLPPKFLNYNSKNIPEEKILTDKMQPMNILNLILIGMFFSEEYERETTLNILRVRNMLRVVY